MDTLYKREWSEAEKYISKVVEDKFHEILDILEDLIPEDIETTSDAIELYSDVDYIEKHIQSAAMYINKFITDYGLKQEEK